MDDKDVRMEIFLIEGEDFFENKSLRGKMDEIIKNSAYELKEIYYNLGIEDKFPNDLGLDFFGFPRSERLYNLIRVEFRKDILYLESLYLSFFNHLNHISYDLLSLRSSLSFMSSLDSTNRLACRSNYDKNITKFSFTNNKSDNFTRGFLNEYGEKKNIHCYNDFNTSLAGFEDNNICSLGETENIRVEKANFSQGVFAEKSQEAEKLKKRLQTTKWKSTK